MLRSCLAALTLCASAFASDAIPQVSHGWPVEAGEAAGYPYDVHYGGYPPGGYERRIGKPYYWSVPGGTVPLDSFAARGSRGYDAGAGRPAPAAGCSCQKGETSGGEVGWVGGGPGPLAHVAAPVPAGPAGDPYTYHFGPGFYRSNEFGHYRFPYYSYRRPWYDVGHPVRVRDTNLPW